MALSKLKFNDDFVFRIPEKEGVNIDDVNKRLADFNRSLYIVSTFVCTEISPFPVN